MLAILFALFSAAGWAVGDIFGTKVSRKIGGYSMALWVSIIGFLLLSVVAPFHIQELQGADVNTIVLAFIIGAVGILPFVAIYEALRVGNAPLVYTIGAASAALIVLFSVVFFGQRVGTDQAVAILLIVVGIILSSANLRNIKMQMILKDKGLKWAFAAMILWGIYYTFISIPVGKIGWFWPNYFTIMMFPLIFIIMKIRRIRIVNPLKKNALGQIVLSALLINIAAFCYNYALTKGETIIVGPISASYPAIFAGIAYFVFRDKITGQQTFGIVIMLLGIILLSIFSYQ